MMHSHFRDMKLNSNKFMAVLILVLMEDALVQ